MGMIWAWISNYAPLQLCHMVIMTFQITDNSAVFSTVCSCTHQRIHQSSTSLAFERGIHKWPVGSPHKGTVMQKMFPFNDVIMKQDFITYPCLKYLYNTVPNVVINGWIAFVKLRFCISTFFRTSDITLLLKYWSYVTYAYANVFMSWVTK